MTNTKTAPAARLATDKQIALIEKLLIEKDVTAFPEDTDVAEFTVKQASAVITLMLQAPKRPVAPVAVEVAEAEVADEEAALANAEWAEFCATQAPEAIIAPVTGPVVAQMAEVLALYPEVAAPAAPAFGPVTEGMYQFDGEIYRVKASKAGNLYAQLKVGAGFEYAPGIVKKLTQEHRMTIEQAEALSIASGHCVRCGRGLVVKKSVDAGIGPVCAKKI